MSDKCTVICSNASGCDHQFIVKVCSVQSLSVCFLPVSAYSCLVFVLSILISLYVYVYCLVLVCDTKGQ